MARHDALDEGTNLDAIQLARALARLEPKITRDPAARLQHSPIERAKTAANLEYARTLLLRLEHAAAQTKAQARRRAAQSTLQQQRAVLKKLTERLAALSHAVPDAVSSDEAWSEDGEDILLQLAPPPASTERPLSSSTTTAAIPTTTPDVHTHATPSATTAPSPVPTDAAAASADNTLRARTASAARNALLDAPAGRTTAREPPAAAAPSKEEKGKDAMSAEGAAALAHADHEQTELTAGMLGLAAALKASAYAFAADLDADGGAVTAAEGALDRSRTGLATTARGLAALRRASEGRWWVTRVGMMVMIPVLWVVALLLVFVGPKIRF